MLISVTITNAETLNGNFSWDQELSSSLFQIDTDTPYISGFAPFTRVTFSKLGDTLNTPPSNEYRKVDEYIEWDFGDQYNFINNKITTPSNIKGVTHTYIMPGVYQTTYTLYEVFQKSNTQTNFTWNDYKQSNVKSSRWDEHNSGTPSPSAWKSNLYCSNGCEDWSIKGAATDKTFTWENVSYSGNKTLDWFKKYNCSGSNDYVVIQTNVNRQDVSVTVQEIAPKAFISCSFEMGVNQITATFSATGCIAGSFPIEEIIWDFDDGSNLIINRNNDYYSKYKDIIYNNFNPDTKNDPRNYNIIHIYNTNNISEVYYPTLTIHSANTYTQDTACDSLGPFEYDDNDSDIVFKKIRARNNNHFFVGDFSGNTFFNILDTKKTKTEINAIFNKTPKSNIKRSAKKAIIIKNNTKNYLADIIENKILTEDNKTLTEIQFIEYIEQRKLDIERKNLIANNYSTVIRADNYSDINI